MGKSAMMTVAAAASDCSVLPGTRVDSSDTGSSHSPGRYPPCVVGHYIWSQRRRNVANVWSGSRRRRRGAAPRLHEAMLPLRESLNSDPEKLTCN